MSQLTPMVEQYMAVKNQHKDELLFFRLGDFYEMFNDDALIASRELNLTLTKRSNSNGSMPMCGVPYHAVEGYIAKLVKKGYRIAICEQTEDPKEAQGEIVEREVIRIITPGTALSEQVLEDGQHRYLVYLLEDGEKICLAAADVSTGDCLWFTAKGKERLGLLSEQLYKLHPAELVLGGEIANWEEFETWLKTKITECLINKNFTQDGTDYYVQHFAQIEVSDLVRRTVRGLLSYLHATVMTNLNHLRQLNEIKQDNLMQLDATAIRNLELLRNMADGGKRGTLLNVLDFTATAMGMRKLRNYIENPLMDLSQIYARQDIVEEFYKDMNLRSALEERLKSVRDLERIVSRLEVGTANARDLLALKVSLMELPDIKQILGGCKSGLAHKYFAAISLHEELRDLLSRAVVDEPPFSVREGGMIRDGFNQELDELRSISNDSKTWMQNFEAKVKEETGIKTMKVGFNKVFGYFIEVSKGQADAVPPNFVRKQTLVNAERFTVPELKEFENKILGAKEKIEQLEYHLFSELRSRVQQETALLQATAEAIANVDALLSFAIAAFKYNYIRPELNNQGEIKITDGRHPVVERLLEKEIFVPNNVNLNDDDEQMIILTGPNMAGKSTYMRQVAILVLLAQIGSFIPARRANICPVDRIFTRVGASDDLASGQSTFMMEMNEVATILRFATKRSLVILDEVGRGTSTFDGMSIARAVLEYIHDKIHAKTLFATHYHQLIAMEQELTGVKNYSVAVKERGNSIVFLRRIVPGGTDKSYGVHVARLAGLPNAVLEKAEQHLKEYDSSEYTAGNKQSVSLFNQDDGAMGLFSESEVSRQLKQLDVMSLTPIEALNTLAKLQDLAKKESGE